MVDMHLENVTKERMAFMKKLITPCFFLTAIFFFSGCYTILYMEPPNEDVSYYLEPIAHFDPEPWPTPAPPPDPGPCPSPPLPPLPAPIQMIVINNPPSTLPITNDHRLTHTGRIPLDANPAPIRNDENNKPTRDSGVQKGRR
jgi:hypothetical protein